MGDSSMLVIKNNIERLKSTITKLNSVSDKVNNFEILDISSELIDIEDEMLLHPLNWALDNATTSDSPLPDDSILADDQSLPEIDTKMLIASLSKPLSLPSEISTRTFVRPKKGRSSLSALVNTPPKIDSPKLRRRLTTTIDPSPALIPHLEELSRVNNRPLSSCDDLRWEDGAAEAEAEKTMSPRSMRMSVPTSLLQRLQEIKANQNTRPLEIKHDQQLRSPFQIMTSRPPSNSMSVSQMLREIPEWDHNADNDSLLSLNEGSFISLNDTKLVESYNGKDPRFSNVFSSDFNSTAQFNNRMTFGGMELPNVLKSAMKKAQQNGDETYKFVEVENEMNSTYNMDDEEVSAKNGHADPFITNDQGTDENKNPDADIIIKSLNTYSTAVLDSTFSKSTELNKTVLVQHSFSEDITSRLAQVNLQNSINRVRGSSSSSNGIESHDTSFTNPAPQEPLNRTTEICSKTMKKTRGSIFMNSTRSSFNRSVDDIPSCRPSSRLAGSQEGLHRSPARSDGTITPVELRLAHGTYTRNSPVERCGSEDEQMSTTSDHSNRSQESLDELPPKLSTPNTGKVSTPMLASVSKKTLGNWEISPISRPRVSGSGSAQGSTENLVSRKQIPHGPVPIKPALIQPTNNFKRPALKKPSLTSSVRVPTKSEPDLSVAGKPSLNASGIAKRSRLPRPPVRTGK